ncbi:hypothetical protein NEOLEDRAFT_1169132 [Neolentinus lepideus HHB14362 ss-1]|uniref:Uncharacterized protein n=1 Tax=Neolentinus lepideus HHB14362 ss-1 TaxID=1314782 RepID=A0A165T632_9AGAM|nr:hypothetical protein NEOLEDRAFT_1169132 [Neolentinus lepideus HHB14362 ss-1]
MKPSWPRRSSAQNAAPVIAAVRISTNPSYRTAKGLGKSAKPLHLLFWVLMAASQVKELSATVDAFRRVYNIDNGLMGVKRIGRHFEDRQALEYPQEGEVLGQDSSAGRRQMVLERRHGGAHQESSPGPEWIGRTSSSVRGYPEIV